MRIEKSFAYYVMGCMFLFLAFFVCSSAQAQTQHKEELVITTYYPAPYGDYRILRLYPTSPTGDSFVCDEAHEGTMYYDQDKKQVMTCRKVDNTHYSWQTVGLWSQTGSSVYPDDLNWNIGIGTNNPQAKLDVAGTMHVSGDIQGDNYMRVKDVYLQSPFDGSEPRWASDQAVISACTCSSDYQYYYWYYWYYGNPSCSCSCPSGYTALTIQSANNSYPYWWYYWYYGSPSSYTLCIKSSKVTSGGYNYSWPWWWPW